MWNVKTYATPDGIGANGSMSVSFKIVPEQHSGKAVSQGTRENSILRTEHMLRNVLI